MWTRSERDQSYYCQFYPYDIAGMLKQPVDKTRAMPLAVPFPRRWIVRTEVTLPVSWPGLNQNKSINDPAFFFEMSLQRAGTSLVMEYEYNSQADSVPAQRAPEYLRKLEAAVQSLGTTLIWQ
jgi:hypothetical protein